MAGKTLACPACGCLNVMPAVDQDGADLKCVSCQFAVHLAADGTVTHTALAPGHKHT